MVHVIAGEIFNLSAFDSVQKFPANKDRGFRVRIGFVRDNEEVDYIGFDTTQERDNAWNLLVKEIDKSFYKD